MTHPFRLCLAFLTWLAMIAWLHASPQTSASEAIAPLSEQTMDDATRTAKQKAEVDSEAATEKLVEKTQALVDEKLNSDLSMAINEIATQEDTSIDEKMDELNSLGSEIMESSLADSMMQPSNSNNLSSMEGGDELPTEPAIEQPESADKQQMEGITAKIPVTPPTVSLANALPPLLPIPDPPSDKTNKGTFYKMRGIFGKLRQKLLHLDGHLTERFRELRHLLLGKPLSQHLMNGTKKVTSKLPRWPDFVSFKERFRKFYRSPSEELFRQIVYLRTQVVVMVQHMRYITGLDRYFLKATKYSDWTEMEYNERMSNMVAMSQLEYLPPYPKHELVRLRMLAIAEHGSTNGKNQLMANRKRVRRQVSDPDGSYDEQRMDEPIEENREIMTATDEEEYDPTELDDVEVLDTDPYEDDDTYSDYEPETDDRRLMSVEDLGDTDDDDDDDDDNDDAGEEVLISMMSRPKADSREPLDTEDELEEILDELVADENDFEPIDLRSTGCLGPVDDQDICGACYAYVATSAAEFYHCRDEGGKFTKLNPRFPTDCGSYFDMKIEGCQGGSLSKALRFMGHCGAYQAVVYEVFRASRPSSYHSDQCPFERPDGETQEERRKNMATWGRVRIKTMESASYYMLDTADWHTHLLAVGPVYINMRTPRNFKEFGGGIYDGTENEEDSIGVHSMMVIGHVKDEDDNRSGYWLVRNSYGSLWGDQGHMRLSDLAVERQVILSIGMKTSNMDNPINSLNRKLHRFYKRR